MHSHSFTHSFGALVVALYLCLGYTLALPTQGSGPVPLTIRSVDGPVRRNGYIITFKPSVDAHDAQNFVVQHFGSGAVRHRYNTTNIDGLAGTFNATQIDVLRTSSFVESIELDSVGEVDSLVVQKDATWGLQRISQLGPISGNPNDMNYTFSYDSSAGSGTDIYIVDSGINIQHTDFGGRATWGMTFGNYTPDVDGLGHGTHVAGIAAGNRFGVAKKANLIAVRIISATGTGYSSDCIGAVNWVINQAKSTGRPSVINISVKFPPNDLLDAVVTDAVNAGVHVVVSAGNAASDASTQSPARAAAATTVGATDITDSMAYYSNFGPLVDLMAPGTNVISDYITSNTATKVDTGTSMASPFVAGLTAYIIGLYGNKSPSDILNLIKSVSPYNKLSAVPADTINQIIDNGAYHLPGYQQAAVLDAVSSSTISSSSSVYSDSVSSDTTSVSSSSTSLPYPSKVDSGTVYSSLPIDSNSASLSTSDSVSASTVSSSASLSTSDSVSASTVSSRTQISTTTGSLSSTITASPTSNSIFSSKTTSITSCKPSLGSVTLAPRPTSSTVAYHRPPVWCRFRWC